MAATRQDPAPHTIRLALSGHVQSSPWAHVMWVFNGKQIDPDVGDLQNFASVVFGFWRDTVLESLSNQTHFNELSCLYWMSDGTVEGAAYASDATGDSGDPPLPANVAVVISWLLSQRYRGGHPRTYLPGIPTGAQSGNRSISETFRLPVNNAANNFHAAVNGYGSGAIGITRLGTVSFRAKKTWRDFPQFRQFIPGSARVDDRLDSQRRRLGPDVP